MTTMTTTCGVCATTVMLAAASCGHCGARGPGQGGRERNAAARAHEELHSEEVLRSASSVALLLVFVFAVVVLVAVAVTA